MVDILFQIRDGFFDRFSFAILSLKEDIKNESKMFTFPYYKIKQFWNPYKSKKKFYYFNRQYFAPKLSY